MLTAIAAPSWYTAAEQFFDENRAWLWLAAGVVIAVTLWLMLTRRYVAAAAWLTYLYMP